MPLSPYRANVLKTELADSAYDGMTADQAWDWLMVPTVSQSQEPTHAMLTPRLAASVIGPLKAEALAAKIKAALPNTADAYLLGGVDLSDDATSAFLDYCVDGTTVLQADVNTLKALGTRTVTTTTKARFSQRFYPGRWPHVAEDGTPGGPGDSMLSGFPNQISRADFDTAWAAAGRS